jgi:hypothetical protein
MLVHPGTDRGMSLGRAGKLKDPIHSAIASGIEVLQTRSADVPTSRAASSGVL